MLKKNEYELIDIEKIGCHKSKPYQEKMVNKTENILKVKFNSSYRYLLLKFGSFYCPNLIDILVKQESKISDLHSIIKLEDIIELNNEYWEGGMPKEFYLFGLDCLGNAFCFSKKSYSNEVYFFDHDFVTITKIADSLIDLYKMYLREIKKGEKI